jgi:NADH-quinone oxidoreductase subunit E
MALNDFGGGRIGGLPVSTDDYALVFSAFAGEGGDLIPILQEVQGRLGYISEEAVKKVSHFLKVSENEIFGVASFYSQFRFVPPGRHSIKVCLGTACHVRGGQILTQALERQLGITSGQTTEDRRFDLQRVACLGCCALAPVVAIDKDIYSRMTVIRLKATLNDYE